MHTCRIHSFFSCCQEAVEIIIRRQLLKNSSMELLQYVVLWNISTIDIKGIIHPKFSHHDIQDVDDLVSSSEQILRNFALDHLLNNGSSAVNGCRQNESPNS